MPVFYASNDECLLYQEVGRFDTPIQAAEEYVAEYDPDEGPVFVTTDSEPNPAFDPDWDEDEENAPFHLNGKVYIFDLCWSADGEPFVMPRADREPPSV